MAQVTLVAAMVCLMGLVSADPSYPSYFYPIEHRSGLQTFPLHSYDYTIIPNDESALIEYDASDDVSLFDYIPNPITAVTTVASKALSVVRYLLPKACLIVVGMALVIAFCAFTPYCTLTIEKPFSRELRTLTNNYPYLDYVEDFMSEAYTKYRDMQNV